MSDLVVFLVTLLVGLVAGSIAEEKHYKSIKKREKKYALIMITNTKVVPDDKNVQEAMLVSGAVVISQDYFKFIVASLKTLVGGRLTSYESLIDRGRREAMLRLKESAFMKGCDLVVSTRIETAPIGQKTGGSGIGCVEVIAYGTGIKYKK